MGRFVDLRYRFCNYTEARVGVGCGRAASPVLKLYTCSNCKSFGSTWIGADRAPTCSGCYHDAIEVLPDDARRTTCPRCGEIALITPIGGEWS